VRILGILGGMAWPSTADAYRLINEEVGRRLGGVHSAPLLVVSFDFAEIEELQATGRWNEAGRVLADGAARLERAGAQGLFLCTNTMHKVAAAIEAATSIPLLHIADATAAAVRAAGVQRVGLLGTRFTMEDDFYQDRLIEQGLDVLVPDAAQRETVHRVIYEELVKGQVHRQSRKRYLEIIDSLVDRGAQGVIAGCTEIELLIGPDDVAVPYFPTTRIHVLAASDWILTST
jgi:aspartate racemase